MNSLSIPASPDAVRLVPASTESRAAKVFADGVPFADRKALVDAKGRPLYRFEAVAELLGQRIGTVNVETPQPLPEGAPLGAVYKPVGQAALVVANRREQFDLGITLRIEGFELFKG